MLKTKTTAPFTADYLNECLDVDFEAGVLVWRERPAEHFPSLAHANAWNGRMAGKPAFTAKSHRYLVGNFQGKVHYAHRIIYLMATGDWPDEVDHIDGDSTNNSIHNLRAADRKTNGRNLKLKDNSTTGANGVRKLPSGRFAAHIRVDGRQIALGTYDTVQEAAGARAKADQQYGFHENHGRAVA